MSSEVRLNCRAAKKLVSKTRKYTRGDYQKTLAKVDKYNDRAFRDQERILEADIEAKKVADAYRID